MVSFITQLINLAVVYIGRNVRLPSLMKIQELMLDIMENGLQTPISVYKVDGRYEVIQGHRRYTAIQALYKNDPKRFAELFPKGIPCTIIEGVTYEEAQEMKVDHGNELSLTDPMELQLCANLLFSQGKGEKAVVTRLASLMDRMKPMKSEKLKKYSAMLNDAKLWIEKGDKAAAKEKTAEAEKFLFDYRRGMVQNLHNAYRCPNIVMAAMYFKAAGIRPASDAEFAIPDKEILPDGITYQHVLSLWKAHEKDLTILENGVAKYSKRMPGPEFSAKWKTIVEELTKKADDTSETPRGKAMSAGEMETELKESKWLSAGFQLLTRHHRKEKDVDFTRLQACDKVAYFAELLSVRAPKEWASALILAEAIEKEQVAATQEAAVPEPAKVIKKAGGKNK